MSHFHHILKGILSQSSGIPTLETIVYGYLYNGFAVADAKNIGNGDFAAPTAANFTTLTNYIQAEITAGRLPNSGIGRILKSQRTAVGEPPVGISTNDHPRWDYHATNFGLDSVQMTLEAGGYRVTNGSFNIPGRYCWMWTKDLAAGNSARIIFENSNAGIVVQDTSPARNGAQVKLVRAATVAEQLLSDGILSDKYYQGNNGYYYKVIKLGTQVWTDFIAETHFANGDEIPKVTNAVDWNNTTTTPAYCAPDDNETYVKV